MGKPACTEPPSPEMSNMTGSGLPHLDGGLGGCAGRQSRDAVGQDRVGSQQSESLRQDRPQASRDMRETAHACRKAAE